MTPTILPILFALFGLLFTAAALGWVEWLAQPLPAAGFALLAMAGFATSLIMVRRMRTQEKEANGAWVDPLTGLPEIHALKRKLANLDAHGIAYLVHLDIDAFYEIADLYGNELADEIIVQVSRLLKTRWGAFEHTIYRYRSNEWLLTGIVPLDKRELKEKTAQIVASVNNHPFVVNGQPVNLFVHAGASNERSRLLETADMALRYAKRQSPKGYAVYDTEMEKHFDFKQNLHWLSEIKSALEEDRIVLYYQPIVKTDDDSINKYECLVRIKGRNGTVHAPQHFMALSERNGLDVDITIRIIDKALASFHNHPAHFSINLAYRSIANPVLTEYIYRRIAQFPEPHRIHFELLESEKIENYPIVRHFIDTIHQFGCQIALDDFGSGHSNFEHILQLDFDMVKIDGSLIKKITYDRTSRLIVRTIVALAKELDIDTCVEYVSDKEIYDLVRKMGLTYMQGHYLSPPKPYH
jgi:EAL domain-containing protein (putative c-di-GMP-specific phosphodiesterase class I)/GGDEF domain-containing protein